MRSNTLVKIMSETLTILSYVVVISRTGESISQSQQSPIQLENKKTIKHKQHEAIYSPT